MTRAPEGARIHATPGARADLRVVLDAAVEAFLVVDTRGRIVDWNRAAERTFGWARAEAVGADMTELLVPADLRAAHRAGVARYLAGEGGHLVGRRIELRAVHRDGHELPVELTLSVIETEGGRHFAALLHDISQRRNAEDRLCRLEAIVAASGDAIVAGSLDGTIEIFNPAAERLYGFSAQEMIGQSVERLRPDGQLASVSESRVLREGRSVFLETRQRRKDGTLVEVGVTMSPLREERGDIRGVVSVVRDVTERTRDAARLAEAHDRFAGAFSAASMGMALVAPDGRLLEVNAALCRLLGRDAQTLRSMTFQELTHPDDLDGDLCELRRALGGDIESYQLTKRYLLPDGGIVWGLLTVSLVRDAGGGPLHFVSQIQDVTDRMTAEGELRRYAAQLEALSGQDPVTGLANRRAFESALAEELAVFAAGGPACSMLIAVVTGDVAGVAQAALALTAANRADDLVAHLGDAQLAVLLRGVDAEQAETIAARLSDGLPADVEIWSVTACDGDNSAALLRRALAGAGARGTGGPSTPPVPSGLDRLLEVARRQLGMPVSFLTRLEGDSYMFVRFGGDHERFGVGDGDAMPLAQTHCARMLDGRIGSTVGDLSVEPHTRDLDVTRGLGLRAYAGVPVRLRSGQVYGTLCTVDTRPHPEISERDVELLRFLSSLAAELIDADAQREHAWRAETAASGVKTLLGALQARDFYTGEHSKEVVALAGAVARRLGLTEGARRDVEQVALLHDIGKVGIPDAVLQKQGPLDEQEWQLMRQHPVVGERIVAGTRGLEHLAPAMRAEHERFDGGGYPDGLAGEEIPLASRITLACDALHAMTSDRPYRPAMSLERACDELRACAGTQFDPRVVQALLLELVAVGPDAAAAASMRDAV